MQMPMFSHLPAHQWSYLPPKGWSCLGHQVSTLPRSDAGQPQAMAAGGTINDHRCKAVEPWQKRLLPTSTTRGGRGVIDWGKGSWCSSRLGAGGHLTSVCRRLRQRTRRLILFLTAGSRYLSHIGIEDFQWLNRSLISAYRGSKGSMNLRTILQIQRSHLRSTYPCNGCRTLQEERTTHACRNTG